MDASQTRLLSLVSGMAKASERREAAQTVAREMGAENMIIFIRDDAIGLLLPASGFQQTLPDCAEWHRFLAACDTKAPRMGRLRLEEGGEEMDVMGITGTDGSVAVLIGGTPHPKSVMSLSLLLPLLSTVFLGERNARIADSHAEMARQAAEQSRLLAGSVDRARAALRHALTDAEEANRAKDRFLASLSHELRTPLTPVLMTAAAMREDESLPEEVHKQLAMMQQNIELEVRLIDDLLDLTRIVNGKLRLQNEDCNVHLLLQHTIEILSPEIKTKALNLEVSAKAAKPWVRGDSARLQQVFWNLVKNGVKFTPEGGTISIVTDNASGQLLVTVSDTGRGIAPELREDIFKPFEQGGLTGEHRFGGLGLGLAISKAVVDMHRGVLEVKSAGTGQGATFSVSLESIEAPDPTTDRKLNQPSVAAGAGLQLLVVEDHPPTLQAIDRMLRRSGHHVTTARSVAEAREAAEGQSFDGVISDVGLPDGSGHDLMQHLRAEYGIKGIAITGYGMEEDLRRSAQSGFVAHLTKPVGIARLRETLQEHFAPERKEA